MSNTIVVDIDGILTLETYGYGKNYYPRRTPNYYNIETLKDYKKRGFKITLYSARYKEDLKMTEGWLKRNKVPYDSLILGKPQADFYVDDKAINQLDREVLCFSGGVDSVIAWHYLNFPQPIYVMMGHKYQLKETNCIGKLKKLIPKLKSIIYYNGPELGRFETGPKAYISQRNFHLALCASHYGNKIYIVGIKDDKIEDKNKAAFDVMSFACNFIRKPGELNIKICSPFWGMTKSQLIRWFIDSYPMDYVEKVLKTSVSCYDANTIGSCGNCFSCARKWLALESAGIKNSHTWFEKDIRKFKGLNEYVVGIKQGKYNIERAKNTREVLEKYGIWK